MESLVQGIFENSKKHPDKTALIFEKNKITYEELWKKINLFAHALKDRKIKKGSRIVLETTDLILFFCGFLGCHLAGCIAVPIEKDISIYKLHDIIKDTKPVLVFMKNNGENYKDYFKAASQKKLAFPKEDADATIVSTTGTTGKPSLVTHTNKSHLAEVQNLCEGTSITEKTVLLTNIPLHLATGYRRVFATLYSGATAVLTNKAVTLEKLKEYAHKYRANHLSLVSMDVALLAKEAEAKEISSLYGIKIVESTTSVLSNDVVINFNKLFSDITFYNVYGATESGCILINDTSENFSEGCIGKPACNAEVFVVDENDRLIQSPGKYGHLAVKGNMNMKGYYKKKALTDSVTRDDAVILSDIVYFDEKGYFYFVSRVGEVINVKGQKIIPTEIEKVAMDFEDISNCACVGKSDPQFGQVPVLFVVCKNEKTFDFNNLKKYLENNLESYRVPKDIIPIDKIPCTPTGKVMRKHLNLLYRQRNI